MTDAQELKAELEKKEVDELAPYALRSRERREALGDRFREHPDPTPLEYRTEYHRDRDRILWSSAFRRLQHKTQIFPHYVEDHYRRRLTHTLEVSQIAGTLCRALRLNETAGEAISLGHDIGHAPFGHGGEATLNRKLIDWHSSTRAGHADSPVDVIALSSTPVLLYGFDHCVQGVEQVSRISVDYRPDFGLNLSFDVRDGIIKHIYDRKPSEAEAEGRPFSSLANIVRLERFKPFGRNCGSLEAQCVWFADKVGYLLGDMEDALRAGIFTCREVRASALVRQIWTQHGRRRKTSGKLKIESRHEFLAFKRGALAVLILDCVEASKRRIQDAGVSCVDDVLSREDRLVDVGEDLRKAWDKFFDKFQKGQLYVDDQIRTCEFKARTIVEGLFEAYVQDEHLIPAEFRDRTSQAYDGMLQDSEVNLMAARNYVAGMTDSYATEQHKRLYMSSERAGVL
ncbi:MAG TPA: dNTP triphosphohydrolase [Thermoguttaceae bacterium]|nr:dNTP triphosphohydrolase [Thermoguttaceae bacterium]